MAYYYLSFIILYLLIILLTYTSILFIIVLIDNFNDIYGVPLAIGDLYVRHFNCIKNAQKLCANQPL